MPTDRGGYRIEYTVDGQRFQRSVRAEITVCTPDAVDPDGSCPMVEE